MILGKIIEKIQSLGLDSYNKFINYKFNYFRKFKNTEL